MKKIVLGVVVTIMLSALILTGCGDKDLSVERLMNDLKTGNITDARSLIVEPDMNSIFGSKNDDIAKSDLGKEYYNNISFTMSDVKIKDDTANANVKFEYPDMSLLINKAFNEVTNGKKISEVKDINKKVNLKIIEYLKAKSFEKKTETVSLAFEKGINQWLIKDNKDLNSVIFEELNLVNQALNGK